MVYQTSKISDNLVVCIGLKMHVLVLFLGRLFPNTIFKPSNINATKHRQPTTNTQKQKSANKLCSNDKKTQFMCIIHLCTKILSINSNNNESPKPRNKSKKKIAVFYQKSSQMTKEKQALIISILFANLRIVFAYVNCKSKHNPSKH